MHTENSSRFFANTACQYYPCHKGADEINCLFCYCPFYHRSDCPGNPVYKQKGDRLVKACTNCIFPHEAKNYGRIQEMISQNLLNGL
ncbi:MAG: metal-binding protein [Lachnospiraceae bacterium]|nr:metal-binding protein [Lachnospiraceae bacterium]